MTDTCPNCGYTVSLSPKELNAACKLVMNAGYSTGHADTCTELVLEMIDNANELRAKKVKLEKKLALDPFNIREESAHLRAALEEITDLGPNHMLGANMHNRLRKLLK